MPEDLTDYVGREAVYLESGSMCVSTVESVDESGDRVRIGFRCEADAKSCRLRFGKSSADDSVAQWMTEAPFGLSWDVQASSRESLRERDFWQVSWLFGGGGIRIFFQPEYVARFLKGDVHWLVEFFDECEDDEGTDENCG
jgi:hypothetical protein